MTNTRLISLLMIFYFINSFYVNIKAEEVFDVSKKEEQFTNQDLLDSIFERLYQLENNRAWKINIVHVGDSHIQADFLTNVIRKSLQSKFGDGGYGFTFPYKLAKTNGTHAVKYTSDAIWKGRLNVSPISPTVNIGLSGIGLSTEDKNFKLKLSTIQELPFNSIKILYSTKESQYQMSLIDNPTIETIVEKSESNEYTSHQVQRGETLYIIATNYKTTIDLIKEENDLESSDNIQAGQILKIPIPGKTTTKKVINKSKDYLEIQSYPYYSSFVSKEPLNNISIYSKGSPKPHDISGFVLENNKPGLVYHCIGVNGAKLSDFNKYPLFFKQLSVLKPDLVILSFGTNESYQKLSVNNYIKRLKEMIHNIKSEYPGSMILVMTPPPSLIRRRTENILIREYSTALINLDNVVVWDLYKKMEGTKGILQGGKYANIIAKDKIHYTVKGYEVQGEMFAHDFLEAYKQFKQKKKD